MSNRDRKRSGRSLFVKLVAWILAGLMILSAAYLAISFLIHSSAAEATGSYSFASSGKDRKNGTYIAVALRWGTSASVSYAVTCPNGFALGEACVTRTARSFTSLFLIDDTEIVIAPDANLKTGYKTCSFASSASAADIGGYHVDISLPASAGSQADVWNSIDDLAQVYSAEYEHVYPAYTDGVKSIRVGAFGSYTAASNAAAAVAAELDGFTVSVSSPSSSGVIVLNEDYDSILFGYSGGENCSGAVAARQTGGERAYLCNVLNGYLYDGVFLFKRYISSDVNALTLINLVSLESYCEGVLPAEIFTSWPEEALTAFAVTVNCFSIGGLNKRFSSYGCDFVASSADQNYSGRHGVTDSVTAACKKADKMVLTYGGTEIVGGAYSSSQGGCSVDTQYVWGGITGPYICSQPTPWEDYSSITRGLWFKEVSATDLAKQIKSYNSSLISGTSISKVTYETTGDSSYVYSMTVTDNKGKSATVTRTSYVNAMMGSYTYSANFVIGKGSVAYTYDKVLSNQIINLNENYSGYLTVSTSSGNFTSAAPFFSFLTDLGVAGTDSSRSLYVATAGGTAELASEQDIPITTLPDSQGIYTYVADYGDFLIVSRLQEVSGVHKASSSSSFAIVGKGFGHGVGMSQYGVYFLAKAGASYDQILRAYYPGTEVENVYDFWGVN
ncbi:MAG: SpoIID/LytB domain-containing protein [Clostridia bacterium]|nr:SpoIID/LytB domain-containing protein [Clostridia bacterium]